MQKLIPVFLFALHAPVAERAELRPWPSLARRLSRGKDGAACGESVAALGLSVIKGRLLATPPGKRE